MNNNKHIFNRRDVLKTLGASAAGLGALSMLGRMSAAATAEDYRAMVWCGPA